MPLVPVLAGFVGLVADRHIKGDVESVEVDPASGRITRVIVLRGVIFRTETAIPASVIASVGDRIALSVGANEVKKLAYPFAGEPGPAHSR